MNEFTIYQKPSGKILGYGMYSVSLAVLQINELQGVVLGKYDSRTQYIDTDIQLVMDKQPFTINQNKTQIMADGMDEWVLSGLPVGSVVTWSDGVVTTVDDGEIVFSVDTVGTYTFKIDPFPYLPLEVSVEAVN